MLGVLVGSGLLLRGPRTPRLHLLRGFNGGKALTRVIFALRSLLS